MQMLPSTITIIIDGAYSLLRDMLQEACITDAEKLGRAFELVT
jgi:hypothetical protein